MTKIKNTKKGMAKKTLSISLVAAMLATSNVPVWADEFSDGTDAAFTSEAEAAPEVAAPETAAPEVQAEEAPVAQTEAYTADVSFNKTALNWNNDEITATVSVKDANGANASYQYAWKVGDSAETAVGEVGTSLTYTTKEADFGKNVYLYLYVEENGKTLWSKTVEAATVGAVDVGVGQYYISWDQFTDSSREYDGKAVTKTAKVMQRNQGVGDTTTTDDWTRNDFTINYSDDLTNAGTVTVKATLNDPKYTGTISQNFTIKPISIDQSYALTLKATLKDTAKSFLFTGKTPTFDKTDATLVDPATGDDISDMITSVTAKPGVRAGEYNAVVAFDDAESVKNYEMAGGTEQAIYSSDTYKIKARDLSDCVFTIDSIEYKNGITAADVKDAITAVTTKDGTKMDLDGVTSRISVELPEGGITAASKTPYTITVKANANSTCLTGKTTASVLIVDRTLSNAEYNKNCAELKDEEYTGSQITKDITELTKAGTGLKLKDGNSTLVYGTHYTIEFGKNTDVKDGGQIIIKGIGAYEGSKKVIPFNITPVTVKSDDLTASKYILYNSEVKKASDYASDFGLVVKAKNTAKKEFTLKEGKDEDYTVVYEYEDGSDEGDAAENKVSDKVKATITFKTKGNFTSTSTLTKSVELVAPVIKDEDIKLKKDTYEYTGSTIIPDFDVVINGKTLTKDVDYTIKNTQDVTEVGTSKVVITGKGNYSNKVDAEASFTVVPADAANLKVTLEGTTQTYDGTAHTPEVLKATLSQNVDLKGQFTVTYGENINAGKGTVTLTPKKDNKNFTGTKTVEFTIEKATLEGTLALYNDKNLLIKDNPIKVDYDGTEKTFAKAVFTPSNVSGSKKLTTDDYEIVYVDNVYGKSWTNVGQLGHVFVVAKGNYKGELSQTSANELDSAGTFTDASGKKITSIVASKFFIINQIEVHKNNITVSNGQYREGYNVTPNVTVTVDGKTLVEGQDYELEYPQVGGKDQKRTDVTATKSLKVTVKPINGYKKSGTEDLTFNWGIDKFDFANADVAVSGTDVAPIVKVLNDKILVDPDNYDLEVKDGKATVSAKKDSKNYTGSKTVDIKHELEKPETPVLSAVNVAGNKATAVLSGECDGAAGYDYVISTDPDCITNKDYDKVNKNILKTQTDFTYVPAGTYYAYCHAWKRGEDGKKVFSEWSNAYPFVVTATTPAQPVITSVKVKGTTVTVTYTKAADATGYDVVLGTKVATVNGEKRPVEYGKLVKKNIKGNTVTATFKNVPKGTYYAGLHAFNRTNVDKTKVFSPWSNTKKVVVK